MFVVNFVGGLKILGEKESAFLAHLGVRQIQGDQIWNDTFN